MVRLALCLAGLLSVWNSHAQHIDKKELRSLFTKASTDQESLVQLQDLLNGSFDMRCEIRCYRSAAKAMKAQYISGISKKVNLAKEATDELNSAVSSDPTNLEAHFVRFTVEQNIPSFLGLSSNLSSDLSFIQKNLRTFYKEDPSGASWIALYLVKKAELSKDQEAFFEGFL